MAKIIFIDEDREVQNLVCAALEQHGYRVNHNWDSTISCVLPQPHEATPRFNEGSFLMALLRTLAPWHC